MVKYHYKNGCCFNTELLYCEVLENYGNRIYVNSIEDLRKLYIIVRDLKHNLELKPYNSFELLKLIRDKIDFEYSIRW